MSCDSLSTSRVSPAEKGNSTAATRPQKQLQLHATPAVLAEITQGLGKTFADLAKGLPSPRGRGRLSPATCYRWATEGILLSDGARLKLEAARVGKWILSSGPALERFLAAQQGQPLPPPATPAASPADARQQARRASELAAADAEATTLGL